MFDRGLGDLAHHLLDCEVIAIHFNKSDIWLIILHRFTGGVEYHPIHVLRQFGLRQDAFELAKCDHTHTRLG